MHNGQPNQNYLGTILFTLFLAVGTVWIGFRYVPHADLGDSFSPLWAASRIVVSDHSNPYDLNAIQRTLRFTDAIPSRFVYPYYALLAYLPFGLFKDYSLAVMVWLAFMVACLVGMVLSTLSLTIWHPSPRSMIVYALFSLSSYSAIRAVYTGNPALLVGLLMVIGLYQVLRGHGRAAGIVFGLTLIKPTMSFLLLVYVVLYAVSIRDLRVVRSMLITMVLLVGSAFAVFPGWFYQNIAQVVHLFKDSYPASITAVIASWFPESKLMLILAAVFTVWLILEWWRSLGKDTRWFVWTAGFTLVVNELIGIPTNTSNYVVLILPLTLVFATIERRWGKAGPNVLLVVVAGLTVATWLPFYMLTGADFSVPEPRFMLFPLPILTLLLLYWVRYWALTSLKLQVERFKALRKL